MKDRIAKHTYDDNWMLVKSTYYVLDAQGNQMNIYEHEVSAENVQYNLVERNIYGSSRIGTFTEKVNLLSENASATQDVVLGNKLYELTNHLGNVLTVIKDIKIPIQATTSDEDDEDEQEEIPNPYFNPDGTIALHNLSLINNTCNQIGLNFNDPPISPANFEFIDIDNDDDLDMRVYSNVGPYENENVFAARVTFKSIPGETYNLNFTLNEMNHIDFLEVYPISCGNWINNGYLYANANGNFGMQVIAQSEVTEFKFYAFKQYQNENGQFVISNLSISGPGEIFPAPVTEIPPSCPTGEISHYEVAILRVTDYSPFGVQLDGRTIEKIVCTEITHESIVNDLNDEFVNGTDGWSPMSNSTSISNNLERLSVTKSNGSGAVGTQKIVSLEANTTYSFSAEVDKDCNNLATSINVRIFLGTDILFSSPVTSTGLTTLSSQFTPSISGNYTVQLVRTGNNGNCTFFLDNIKISHIEEETEIVCNEDGNYRYSFQNQEHDDEIKGRGNSINYTFRMHDPRLGRFFAVDPLAFSYPHNSPYAFSENVVINAVELEGLEKVALSGTGNGENYPTGDIKAFDVRGSDLEKKGYTKFVVATGEDIINALVKETQEKGMITNIVHFAHGIPEGISLNWDQGMFKDGFLRKKGGLRTISDLKEKINNGEIKLSLDATWVMGSCYAGSGKNSFAEKIALETGITVIASISQVGPENVDGQRTGRLKGSFYKFERFYVVKEGNNILGTYKTEDEAKKSVQEIDNSTIKIDAIVKKTKIGTYVDPDPISEE